MYADDDKRVVFAFFIDNFRLINARSTIVKKLCFFYLYDLSHCFIRGLFVVLRINLKTTL